MEKARTQIVDRCAGAQRSPGGGALFRALRRSRLRRWTDMRANHTLSDFPTGRRCSRWRRSASGCACLTGALARQGNEGALEAMLGQLELIFGPMARKAFVRGYVQARERTRTTRVGAAVVSFQVPGCSSEPSTGQPQTKQCIRSRFPAGLGCGPPDPRRLQLTHARGGCGGPQSAVRRGCGRDAGGGVRGRARLPRAPNDSPRGDGERRTRGCPGATRTSDERRTAAVVVAVGDGLAVATALEGC